MSQVLAFVGGEDVALNEASIESAVAGVTATIAQTRRLTSYERAAILDKVVLGLKVDADAIVDAMTEESGCLTRRDMVLELERTIEVFSLSAAVAREGIHTTVNLDAALRGKDATGLVRAEPIGPVLGITAFNGPMLIAVHKIAPPSSAAIRSSSNRRPAYRAPLCCWPSGWLPPAGRPTRWRSCRSTTMRR